MPLDPYHLTPEISLNRVRVVDLPGLAPDLRGRTAYDLISTAALAVLVRARAGDLRLDPALPDGDLVRSLDACLDSGTPPVQAAAESVARQAGERLGWVLLALRRGDPVNRAARPEWDDSYWAHWAGIRRVYLGGGLAAGWLGAFLVEGARTVLARAGIDDTTVVVSPYGPALPLVGAARCAPPESGAVPVLDFGSTWIKRAWAEYAGGVLVVLHRQPPIPCGWDAVTAATGDPVARARRVLDHMLASIRSVWDTAGVPLDGYVIASVSAYIRDGHPLPAQHGIYMQLDHLTGNAARTLADALSADRGAAVGVTLLHDGTAAALAHAGEEHTAVITLGTALGIGFPPPAEGLRAIGTAFVP